MLHRPFKYCVDVLQRSIRWLHINLSGCITPKSLGGVNYILEEASSLRVTVENEQQAELLKKTGTIQPKRALAIEGNIEGLLSPAFYNGAGLDWLHIHPNTKLDVDRETLETLMLREDLHELSASNISVMKEDLKHCAEKLLRAKQVKILCLSNDGILWNKFDDLEQLFTYGRLDAIQKEWMSDHSFRLTYENHRVLITMNKWTKSIRPVEFGGRHTHH